MGGPGSPGSVPPPPPALFFSLLVREALLPGPLSIGDTRLRGGLGRAPAPQPLGVPRSRLPLGWGAQAAAATLGPDGGWAPGAGFEGGVRRVGEAVGGLAARMGFFTLEPNCPPPAPGSEFEVHQRNADWPVMEEGLQLGSVWKGYVDSQLKAHGRAVVGGEPC